MTNKEAIEFLKNMIDREGIGFIAPQREGDVAIWQYHVEALQMSIKALSVDAVQVVRCKDCKHWKQTDEIPVHYGECLDSVFGYVAPREDFFCANGERREE